MTTMASPAMKGAKNLITVIGTTGVGKSQFSVELAKALNGEIINGDSMQVYRGLDNITNKHPDAERENIPHHLLGHVAWADEYSVQQFEREALRAIADVHARGKLPILVGGTHYYNQAVIFKNSTLTETEDEPVEDPAKLTQEQRDILDGPAAGILQQLRVHDPLVAQKFHPNDGRRLRRALEVFYLTGRRPSDIYLQQKQAQTAADSGDAALSARFRTLVFWIWSEQSVLNERLDTRVDVMMQNGLRTEIDEMYAEYARLAAQQTTTDLTKGVWQVIGFRQFLPWLHETAAAPEQDHQALLDSCVDEMKRNTRKYSKQQTKFMKNTLMPKINLVIDRNKKETAKSESLVATILDASDLSKWATQVGDKGVRIAKEFIDGRLDNCILLEDVPVEEASSSTDSDAQNPSTDHDLARVQKLRDLLVTPKQFDETQWQTFTCNVCMSSTPDNTTDSPTPYVAVGEAQWREHVRSRKHKTTLAKMAKMKRNAEEIAKRGGTKKQQLERAAAEPEHVK